MSAILTITGLQKRFRGIEVLKDIDLEIPRGKVTALIGSNGAGKSTILNVVSGLIRPDAGVIEFDATDVTRLPAYKRARLGLARTFQHPRSFKTLTVLESVLFACTGPQKEHLSRSLLSRFFPKPASEASATLHAREILDKCKLSNQVDVTAEALSYGDQKLLMLAQVLATRSKLLCFDELCAGLENEVVQDVRHIFRSLADAGSSVLFIEHNLNLVRELADWVVFLHLGTVFRSGKTEDVLTDRDVVKHYLGQ